MKKRQIQRSRKSRPRVYIIDDSLIFRAMLETMVGDDAAFDICGVASSCDEARKDIKWVLPDIVLLDLNMPGTHGLTFLEELSDYWHAMSIVVISGDALTDMDLTKMVRFHKENGALVTVGLTKVPDPLEFGIVIADDDGIVVWPAEQLDDLLAKAKARLDSDNGRLEALEARRRSGPSSAPR